MGIGNSYRETCTHVAKIDPDNASAATYTTGWMPLLVQKNTLSHTVLVGAMTTSATLDAKLEQAQDSSGTGAKDISNKSATQLTEAGGDGDQVLVLEAEANDLDLSNSFNHVRLSVTVGTAATYFGAVVVSYWIGRPSLADSEPTFVADSL